MNTEIQSEYSRFLATLATWPTGYTTGCFETDRYGVSVTRPIDWRVTKVFAEALGGSDIVSFNLFWLDDDRPLLKPCEMSPEKVTRFVLGFEPDKSVAVLP